MRLPMSQRGANFSSDFEEVVEVQRLDEEARQRELESGFAIAVGKGKGQHERENGSELPARTHRRQNLKTAAFGDIQVDDGQVDFGNVRVVAMFFDVGEGRRAVVEDGEVGLDA